MAKKEKGRRIILADNTKIEGGECGYSDGFIWCWMSGKTMAQAAAIFTKPKNTEVIVFEYGEMSDRYEGYTECRNIMMESDGRIAVCMTKAVN